MPKRPAPHRGKKKPIRVDAQTKKLFDEKFHGKDAPAITDRAKFLSWCAAMIDLPEAKEWLEDYLKTTGRSLKGVPDKWLNPSVCHRARLKTLGAPFTEYQDQFLEEGILSILKHAESEVSDKPGRPTIADNVRERASEVIGELEGLLDDGFPEEFNVAKWYRENEVSPTIAARVVKKFEPRLEELALAVEGSDEQVNESYSRVEPETIFWHQEWIGTLVNDTNAFVQNSKKARVARKPKPVSVAKKLRHIAEVYLKHSKEFNVTSIDPAKILGAKELWALNVKYRLLTVYRAESLGGELDVARCKVAGFNRNDSHTYRLGRKSEALVNEALKSSKAALKKLISNLKEAPVQERVGENTVLLRVF